MPPFKSSTCIASSFEFHQPIEIDRIPIFPLLVNDISAKFIGLETVNLL